jgi:hypothetical protein
MGRKQVSYVVRTFRVSRLEHILMEARSDDGAYSEFPSLGYSDDPGYSPVVFEQSEEFPTKKAALAWFKANVNYYKDGW